MEDWVASIALFLAVTSFALFCLTVLIPLLRPPIPVPMAQHDQADPGDGVAKATEALAKLVDSLAKAGPSVLCLTGSFVFVLIAYLAAKAG